jgi:hypothetical protein
VEEYRGQSLATQLREIRQVFAEQEKSGLDARCIIVAARSGYVMMHCKYGTMQNNELLLLSPQQRREHHAVQSPRVIISADRLFPPRTQLEIVASVAY